MWFSAEDDCSIVPSVYICFVGHHFAVDLLLVLVLVLALVDMFKEKDD